MRFATHLSLLVLLAAGCRDAPSSNGLSDTGSGLSGDGGGPKTCSRREDCSSYETCAGGICEGVVSCQSDDQCTSLGKVCHTTRRFCVECDGRHANECPLGASCQFDFTCVGPAGDAGVGDAGACSGTCTDRSECAPDRICRLGGCCPPPSRCTGSSDCPMSRPECNAATGECFGGDSCVRPEDCNDKPGCANQACECDAPAVGQPGECRPRPDECSKDSDCLPESPVKYCALSATPRRCLEAPACTADPACAAVALVCDLSNGSPRYQHCVNGQACPLGNECTAATQVCTNGACVAKSCLTTPSLCNPLTERCETSTGQCVPKVTAACARDEDCNTGNWCNLDSGQCEPGCRTSADCPGGICDPDHQCLIGTGQLCGPCVTDAECPAGTKCQTSVTGQKKCYEPCFAGSACTLNTAAVCILIRCSCL